MEIKRLKTAECTQYTWEELNELVSIDKVSPKLAEKVMLFKAEYGIIDQTEATFACVLTMDEKEIIVGYVSLEQNDIRTKFPYPPDEIERAYHEFVCFALDEKLFNSKFLVKCFQQILKQTTEIDKETEVVFWFDYQGKPVSQVIDCGVLKKMGTKYEYHFINEAEYFALNYMQAIQISNQLRAIK